MTDVDDSVNAKTTPVRLRLKDEGQLLATEDLLRRREEVRTFRGRQRVDHPLDATVNTARERIDMISDAGSFEEVGTFVVSGRASDSETTPGDGKITGHAKVDGRPITIVADDINVKRGSTATMGSRRKKRMLAQALKRGNPFVALGESAGARIPDILGAEGLTEMELDSASSMRQRRIPMISVITGQSFGGSSFAAAHSDLVVQVRGSSLSITSPRLIEVATGEQVTALELGGVDVHMQITGQVDFGAEDDADAARIVRDILSYLPSNSWSVPDRTPFDPDSLIDVTLADEVPSRMRRAYDMRKVLRRLADDGRFLEIQSEFGRPLITALTRIGGFSVGVIASQPMFQAGALDSDSCDKAIRFMCLCEANNIPILFLQDLPGFMVGKKVEHERLLARAIMMQQAFAMLTVPKLTVVLRKAYGFGYFALGGIFESVDGLYAWPNARFGFMDQKAGAQVVVGNDLSGLGADQRQRVLAESESEFETEFDAYVPARRMRIDEVINPAESRRVIVRDLERLAPNAYDAKSPKPLMSWPTRW
ncbi:acyl-CoA carboxylase subunit beta [Homoserinimonas sp. A447]